MQRYLLRVFSAVKKNKENFSMFWKADEGSTLFQGENCQCSASLLPGVTCFVQQLVLYYSFAAVKKAGHEVEQLDLRVIPG